MRRSNREKRVAHGVTSSPFFAPLFFKSFLETLPLSPVDAVFDGPRQGIAVHFFFLHSGSPPPSPGPWPLGILRVIIILWRPVVPLFAFLGVFPLLSHHSLIAFPSPNLRHNLYRERFARGSTQISLDRNDELSFAPFLVSPLPLHWFLPLTAFSFFFCSQKGPGPERQTLHAKLKVFFLFFSCLSLFPFSTCPFFFPL